MEYRSTYSSPLDKYIDKEYAEKEEAREKAYKEWYRYVSKKFIWSSLNVIWKSFYHWNLFWIPIIVFSFMAYNYKKLKK
jgi:hypothetical protein